MIKPRQYTIFIITAISFFLFLTYDISGRICANGSGGGYGDDSTGTSSLVDNSENTIENYVIEGAGDFLNGYSDILALSDTVESFQVRNTQSSDINKSIENAIFNMSNAIATYEDLVKVAESTPYNEKTISKLNAFEYDEFMKLNKLNSVIFNKVKAFLIVGDITGMYKEILSKFKSILDSLNTAKEQVNTIGMLETEVLWQLNDLSSQTLLFGQYVARVFDALQ